MNIKKRMLTILMLALLNGITGVHAADLLKVYLQAQVSDPDYKKAKATYMGKLATLPQALASFLPNLDLTSNWNKSIGHDKANPFNSLQTTLSVKQTLFDWNALKNYREAKLDIKAAAATYGAAAEALIRRTATAYFNVLADEDLLYYAAANKRQSYRSLKVAEQRYKVGLDAITSLYEARSQYDAAIADYIGKESQLANDKEKLYQITGQFYPSLARLKENFPLVKPLPTSINLLETLVNQQNLQLMAARYSLLVAKENIKAQSAKRLPTLNLNGNYTDSRDKLGSNNTVDKSVGLTLNVPLYTGGLISAQTKAAKYSYQEAAAEMDSTHRQVTANARMSYLNILAAISKIQADRQAIKSAKASLASNETSYRVGTKTVSDVLNAQTKLYNIEQTYAKDRFEYINNIFALKQVTGTLTVKDIEAVNHWLTDAPDEIEQPQKFNMPKQLKPKATKKT